MGAARSRPTERSSWARRASQSGPPPGEPLDLKPDLDQVPALAAERDAQWSRVAAADFLTQDEKRALLGLPALARDGATADG